MIKTFFKNTFVYTLGIVLTRGIGIFLIPIYTRYLSPSEYGVIDLFTIVASLISLTISIEIHQAVVRFYQEASSEKEKTEYVSTAFIFTVLVYGLYFIISWIFSDALTMFLLDTLEYHNIFLLATGTIFTKGLSYFTQGQLKWQILPKKFVIVSVVQVIVVATVSIYLLVLEDMKIESIFIGQISGHIVSIFLSIYYAKNSYKLTFNYEKFGEMISFSFPLVLSGVAIFVALFIDRIAIKYFFGLDDLGIYGLAYRFTTITSLVMIGFQSSLSPLIYKHYKDINTPLNMVKIFEIFVLFSVFVVSGSILFSREVIVFMTTSEYSRVASLIPILVTAVFFMDMYIFAPGLAIAKKTKIIAIISIIGAMLNTLLNIVFIPFGGMEGAAYATLLSAIIIFILRVQMSNKYYSIPYKWNRIIFSFVLAIISSCIIQDLFEIINLFNFSLKLLFLISLSGGLTYFLIGPNSLKIVLNQLKNKFRKVS